MPPLKLANDALAVAVDVRANLHNWRAPVSGVSIGFGVMRGISTSRQARPLMPNATRTFSATGDCG